MRVSLPMHTAGLLLLADKTLPAAYPRRSTKSGVIGLEPTVPRTPSVPKYLRVIFISLPHGNDVFGLFHVVHTEYVRAAVQREQSEGQASGEALLHRPAGDQPQRRLARQAREHRNAERLELVQSPEQLEIVCHGLAEAESRIDHDAVGANPGEARLPHLIFQEGPDLLHH